MEWKGGENLLSDISLPPTPAPEKSITSKKGFWESTSCIRNKREAGGEEGGRKVRFLRHVSLICPPAANENDDLQKAFFSLSLGSASPQANHSWSHTLNKCNLYSIMNTRKDSDRTHGPSAHTDFIVKLLAAVHPWVYAVVPVTSAGSANFITCIGSWYDSLILSSD